MLQNIQKLYDFKSHIKNNTNINKAGITSASLLLLISTLAVLPFVPHMDGAEAAPSPTESESVISVVTDNESARLDLVPGTESGVFATSKEEDLAKFRVTTNSFTGYTLSVISSDDEGQLVSSDPTNETKLNSIDNIVGKTTFKDGTVYNGKWGFKPNKYVLNGEVIDNTTLENYLPSPTDSGTTIDITRRANTTPNEYTIALGARANSTFQQGTYSKTFSLVAVGNPATYTVTFTDNTGDATVANIPEAIGGSSATSSITLPNTTPTRDGHNFAGWCSEAPVGGLCPSGATLYQAGGEFYLDQTIDNVETLYAIWGANMYNMIISFAGEGVKNVKVCTKAGDCEGDNLVGIISTSGGYLSNLISGKTYYLYPGFATLYTIADWAKTSTFGTLSSATDFNPTFTIGAGDASVRITGKRMNMQELGSLSDKDRGDAIAFMTSDTTYSFIDSRDGNTYSVRKINGTPWMVQNLRYVGDTGSTSDYMVMKAATSNISEDQNLPIGDLTLGDSYDAARIHIATSDQVPSGATYTAADMGVWYNYAAATAGAITGVSNTAEAEASICPKGWRLPTYAEVMPFQSLDDAVPQYFNDGPAITGGRYVSGEIVDAGKGVWWTTTASAGDSRRSFLEYNGSKMAAGSVGRIVGNYVRCVLPDSRTITDIVDMQDITGPILSNTSDGATATLTDSRDGNTYTVRRIGNRLWMVQNLRYVGDTGSTSDYMVMKAATSDISEDQNLPIGDLTLGNSNVAARIHIATSDQVPSGATYTAADMGVWYNYAAATAGSLSSTYSICPKGWRLQANSESPGTTSKYFNDGPAITGGRYYNSKIADTEKGYWWTSTTSDSSNAYYLLYNGNSLEANNRTTKSNGLYVRCVTYIVASQYYQ